MIVRVERLAGVSVADAARVMRAAFDDRLPWLSGLHTLYEDEQFFRNHVFRTCAVWGAFDGPILVGIIAFRVGWIDQLYVLPDMQRCGIGTMLLTIAKEAASDLCLWTFQRNKLARCFYERHGFVAVEQTDGDHNEEQEPDVRYRWQA